MLKIRVMQTPSVEIDGQPVSFPFKRADALLYYMIVQRSASRQELVALLWEDCDEANGLKQLRNTLYHLKKILGGDFLISPQKSVIRVNPDWEVDCDYERFVQDGDLDAYQGAFLQGFGVKRAFSFEEWMCRMADRLQDLYLQKLVAAAEEAEGRGDFRTAALLYVRGLREDEYNESLTAGLMECCRQVKDYARGADLYQNLKKWLKDEMGTEPLEQTKELYYQILNEWDNQASSGHPAPPVGREQAFAALCRGMEDLQSGEETSCAWMVRGDAGTGKQELIDFFLRWGPVEGCGIQRVECLVSERGIPLMAWEHLLFKLWELATLQDLHLSIPVMAQLESAFGLSDQGRRLGSDIRMARRSTPELESAVEKLLWELNSRRPLLIVMENLHWMDDESLKLLHHVLSQNPSFGILLTCREYCGSFPRETLTGILNHSLIHTAHLQLLDLAQVREMLQRELGEGAAERLTGQFYKDTCGDVHLLAELIRSARESITQGRPEKNPELVLFSHLQGLSEQAMQVVRILSVYPAEIPISLYLQLYSGSENSLTSALRELLRAGVVEELHSSEICYRLTHPRLREMIYERMSVLERRPLHSRIADVLADQVSQKGGSWQEVSRQYELAGDRRRGLEYRIREVTRIGTLAFVPFMAKGNEEPVKADPGEIIAETMKCQRELTQVFQEASDESVIRRMECDLLEIRGIAEIYQGDYSQGVTSLGNISGRSMDHREDRQLRVCALLGELAVRQQEVEKAERYVATGMRVLERKRNPLELAIFRRLQGCCFILRKAYDKAGYYLIEAMELLESMQDSTGSRLQLALAYCDYGRLSRYQNKYAKACSFFKKSLAMMEGRDWNFAVWTYVHYGRTVYALEDHLTARELFREACRIAQATGQLLEGGSAEAYAAIYAARSFDAAEAAVHLRRAGQIVQRADSSLDRCIYNYSCMILRRMMDQHQLTSEELERLLPESPKEYAHRGIREIRFEDVFEAEEMKQMLKTDLADKDHYRASDLYSKNKWFMTE